MSELHPAYGDPNIWNDGLMVKCFNCTATLNNPVDTVEDVVCGECDAGE